MKLTSVLKNLFRRCPVVHTVTLGIADSEGNVVRNHTKKKIYAA